MPDAFEKMDRMYRYQRYFYDLTRKYYLLGRDKLIDEIMVEPGANVLEIGCGTGRNLILLAEKHPDARFFGLDASAAMLQTARQKIDARRDLKTIELRHALAGDFSFDRTFDLEKRFDSVFFSYAISIIPNWRQAFENALENTKPGRSVFIVDFYDQKNLPGWFRKLLKNWLKRFHVEYPENLIPYLEDLEKSGRGVLRVESICRSYAFIARFQKL